jgi:hypothetical protein
MRRGFGAALFAQTGGGALVNSDSFARRLLPDETILWTGRPGQGLMFSSRDIFLVPFSLLWCGFAIFWESNVWRMNGAPDFFMLWGASFVCIGLYFVFGRFVADAWVRKGMKYAVTDKRILIERSAPFAKFSAVAIAQIADVDLSENADGRGTIRFGPAMSLLGRQNMGLWSPALDTVPQFIMIDGASWVFRLVQQQTLPR